MTNSTEFPQVWQKSVYNSFGIIRLHEEITDFCNYSQPTVLEEIVRNYVLNRVKSVLIKRWPLIEVHIFGSFATGLYLPTSDIDIVVFGKWETLPLWDVEKLLQESGISTNIRVIDKASVPIVKFVECETGYQVDISFNKDNGIKSIPLINEYITKFPNLKKLYLVLKQFMLQRDLNEVWTGGISSYCLMLLCISFLQNYNKNCTGNINLGCLLMEFFELYGRCFNFFNSAIYVTKKGGYRIKLDSSNGQKSSIITVDDPIDKENDVAKSCFGLFNIRHAFANAYCLLSSKVIPTSLVANLNGSTKIPMDTSILGSIISVSPAAIKFREDIQSKFAVFVNFDWEKIRLQLPLAADPIPSTGCSSSPEKSPRRTSKRKITKSVTPGSVKAKKPRKISKARNWNDLAQWSQENAFKSPVAI